MSIPQGDYPITPATSTSVGGPSEVKGKDQLQVKRAKFQATEAIKESFESFKSIVLKGLNQANKFLRPEAYYLKSLKNFQNGIDKVGINPETNKFDVNEIRNLNTGLSTLEAELSTNKRLDPDVMASLRARIDRAYINLKSAILKKTSNFVDIKLYDCMKKNPKLALQDLIAIKTEIKLSIIEDKIGLTITDPVDFVILGQSAVPQSGEESLTQRPDANSFSMSTLDHLNEFLERLVSMKSSTKEGISKEINKPFMFEEEGTLESALQEITYVSEQFNLLNTLSLLNSERIQGLRANLDKIEESIKNLPTDETKISIHNQINVLRNELTIVSEQNQKTKPAELTPPTPVTERAGELKTSENPIPHRIRVIPPPPESEIQTIASTSTPSAETQTPIAPRKSSWKTRGPIPAPAAEATFEDYKVKTKENFAKIWNNSENDESKVVAFLKKASEGIDNSQRSPQQKQELKNLLLPPAVLNRIDELGLTPKEKQEKLERLSTKLLSDLDNFNLDLRFNSMNAILDPVMNEWVNTEKTFEFTAIIHKEMLNQLLANNDLLSANSEDRKKIETLKKSLDEVIESARKNHDALMKLHSIEERLKYFSSPAFKEHLSLFKKGLPVYVECMAILEKIQINQESKDKLFLNKLNLRVMTESLKKQSEQLGLSVNISNLSDLGIMLMQRPLKYPLLSRDLTKAKLSETLKDEVSVLNDNLNVYAYSFNANQALIDAKKPIEKDVASINDINDLMSVASGLQKFLEGETKAVQPLFPDPTERQQVVLSLLSQATEKILNAKTESWGPDKNEKNFDLRYLNKLSNTLESLSKLKIMLNTFAFENPSNKKMLQDKLDKLTKHLTGQVLIQLEAVRENALNQLPKAGSQEFKYSPSHLTALHNTVKSLKVVDGMVENLQSIAPAYTANLREAFRKIEREVIKHVFKELEGAEDQVRPLLLIPLASKDSEDISKVRDNVNRIMEELDVYSEDFTKKLETWNSKTINGILPRLVKIAEKGRVESGYVSTLQSTDLKKVQTELKRVEFLMRNISEGGMFKSSLTESVEITKDLKESGNLEKVARYLGVDSKDLKNQSDYLTAYQKQLMAKRDELVKLNYEQVVKDQNKVLSDLRSTYNGNKPREFIKDYVKMIGEFLRGRINLDRDSGIKDFQNFVVSERENLKEIIKEKQPGIMFKEENKSMDSSEYINFQIMSLINDLNKEIDVNKL